jgi:hypothetical protein
VIRIRPFRYLEAAQDFDRENEHFRNQSQHLCKAKSVIEAVQQHAVGPCASSNIVGRLRGRRKRQRNPGTTSRAVT